MSRSPQLGWVIRRPTDQGVHMATLGSLDVKARDAHAAATMRIRPVLLVGGSIAVGAIATGAQGELPGPDCNGYPVTQPAGDAHDNVIVGTPHRDVLVGHDGHDYLRGRGGNDIICGDDGRDLLDGGGGDDRLNAGSGHDRVLGANGDDTLKGLGHSENGVREFGAQGTRQAGLFGGAGDDVLYGGLGRRDLCVGGSERDADVANQSCDRVEGVP